MIEAQHDPEYMATLVELMGATNAMTDPRAVAAQTLDQLIARDLISAGSIWLARSGDLVGLAARGLAEDTALPAIRRALAAPDPQPQTLAHQRQSSLVVLPLTSSGAQIGALAVETHAPLNPSALLLLQVIAAHLAGVLGQARPGERAAASDREWDRFLAHAAHEIKNPLASIKGYADLLLRRAAKEPDTPYYKGLTTISQQVGRTTALLEQLSDIARIGADRLPIDRHVGDFVALVDSVVQEYQPIDQQHMISFDRGDTALPCRFDYSRMRSRTRWRRSRATPICCCGARPKIRPTRITKA